MDAFESCIMDILGDTGIYMDQASVELAEKCPSCNGTGETLLPETDRQIAMQMLSALARDMGGSSTVPVAGDECRRCNGTGKIADDTAILTRAAMACAKDWRDELRGTLAQTNEERDVAIVAARAG